MFINILMITFVILAVGSIFYSLRAFLRKYSKAKFAFASLSALTSLSFLIILSLLARETPLQSLLIIIAQISGITYAPVGPSSLELVIVCIVTFMLNNTGQNIFRNWDGPVTVEQHKRKARQEKSTLISDGLREVLRLVRRRPESPIYSKSERREENGKLTPPQDSLAWNYNLRDLYLLKSPSLSIPVNEGWHDLENCWVGENKRNANIVIIGCSIEIPNEEQLSKFANYVKSLADSSGISIKKTELHWGFKIDRPDFTWSNSEISFKCESEKTLLDNLVNFQDYYFDITDRVDRMCLPESDLKLNDVYVESCCDDKEGTCENIGIESFLHNWLKEKDYKQLALLGEYGQGKSTCALMFTYHLISETTPLKDRIPLLIELRGKAPSTMSPEELLATWAVSYRIDPMALKKLLIAGRLLLIFDGFDEMAFISQGETRVAHFRTIWQLSYPKNKILITGRPNFFLDDSEMKAALGLRDNVPERPHCEAIYLQPFTIHQMREALRHFKKETRAQICDFAEANIKFCDLASRPCLLYIIGLLWERPSMSKLKDNLNSASIIDLFVKHSLERQDAKNREDNRFMVLHTLERSFFMEGVASYMLANQFPNQISNNNLRTCVSILLDIIPESILDDTDAMSKGSSLKPLKERISNDETMIENLQTDVRTYGLLVNDPSKAGTMRFAHKSFMEFLVAKVLANSMVHPKQESAIALCNSQELYLGAVARQREAFSFFAELIQESYDKEIADEEGLTQYILNVITYSKLSCRMASFFCRFNFEFKAATIILLSRMAKNKLKKIEIDSEHYKKCKEFIDVFEDTFTTKSKMQSSFGFLAFFIIGFPFSVSVNSIARNWEMCCYEIGISSDSMAKFVGPYFVKSYFDFSRRQYFEGFTLSNLNDDPIDMLLKTVRFLYLTDKKANKSFESDS